ncbi:MAG TPA: hypothetical protein VJK54_00575, partial [Chthoniobacterales bacterium]|nr:hypothetical protein [Chthoniobacterales bacterium]
MFPQDFNTYPHLFFTIANILYLEFLKSDGVTGIAPRDPSTPPDMRISHPAVEQSRGHLTASASS